VIIEVGTWEMRYIMTRQTGWDFAAEIATMRKSHTDAKQIAWFGDNPRSELERLSALATPEFFQVTQLLSRYAGWEGVEGALQAADGNPIAWEHLQRSLLYRYLSTRIRFALCDRKPGQIPFLMGVEPLVLAHAICMRQDEMARWFGNRGAAGYELDPKTISRFQHFCTPLNRFMLELFGVWTCREIQIPSTIQPLQGPLGTLLDRWPEREYGQLITAACEFYVIESNKDSSELGAMPYNVFPAPLLALLRIRKELGLAPPITDHPLLNSKLAQIPPVLAAVHDSLLDKIERRAREAFPEISESF
jgi:hypothetical protein